MLLQSVQCIKCNKQSIRKLCVSFWHMDILCTSHRMMACLLTSTSAFGCTFAAAAGTSMGEHCSRAHIAAGH